VAQRYGLGQHAKGGLKCVAGRADLYIQQGDDYQAVVTVSDASTPPGQVLAGYTAQAQIRCGRADENPQVVVEIATAVTRRTSRRRSHTRRLEGPYVWDLQVTSPNGNTVHLRRHPAPNHALSERGIEWFLR
jgi:hypothetical protein